MRYVGISLSAILLVAPFSIHGKELAIQDATPGLPFKEGDLISFDQIAKLESYLPPEFWKHREYFFYDGMEIKIGPIGRDYTPADAYQNASAKSKAHVGPYGALLNNRAGQPFPTDEIS